MRFEALKTEGNQIIEEVVMARIMAGIMLSGFELDLTNLIANCDVLVVPASCNACFYDVVSR